MVLRLSNNWVSEWPKETQDRYLRWARALRVSPHTEWLRVEMRNLHELGVPHFTTSMEILEAGNGR